MTRFSADKIETCEFMNIRAGIQGTIYPRDRKGNSGSKELDREQGPAATEYKILTSAPEVLRDFLDATMLFTNQQERQSIVNIQVAEQGFCRPCLPRKKTVSYRTNANFMYSKMTI